MPYRKEQFVNGEIYHLILRGIDGNLIFKDIDDYYRGIFSVYEFNNAKPVTIRERRKARLRFKKLQNQVNRGPSSVDESSVDEFRDKLVEIIAFCFMPNHLHLLVRQIKDGGITKFMSKFGTGYGRYFNTKYRRKGHLFQNRFVAIHIKDDRQLETIFVYIHANPISLIEPKWKEKGVKNLRKALRFLENYKWSSYRDYLEKNNFPSVTEREFMKEIIDQLGGTKNLVKNWIEYKKEFPDYLLQED